MSFDPLVFTDAGKTIYYRNLSGEHLKFTTIKIGDGALGTTPIAQLSGVINPLITISVTVTPKDAMAIVRGQFNNSSLSIGFYWREIGLYIANPDGGADVLYAYQNAGGTAEFIPPSTQETVEKSISIPVLVGDMENISATLDSSAIYVTAADYNADMANLPNIYIPQTQKGAPNGVTPLNGSGKIANTYLPTGSTSQAGIVQIVDSISSTSTTQAASPNSVKQAYDRGSTAITIANNAIPISQKGAASGVAPLDGTGKIPDNYIPITLSGNRIISMGEVLDIGSYLDFHRNGESGLDYTARLQAQDGMLYQHTGVNPYNGYLLTTGCYNQPNGVTQLDNSGKVPESRIPDTLNGNRRIATDSVLEVGQYIDFHEGNDGQDFAARLFVGDGRLMAQSTQDPQGTGMIVTTGSLNQPYGVPQLDASGKLLSSQLPGALYGRTQKIERTMTGNNTGGNYNDLLTINRGAVIDAFYIRMSANTVNAGFRIIVDGNILHDSSITLIGGSNVYSHANSVKLLLMNDFSTSANEPFAPATIPIVCQGSMSIAYRCDGVLTDGRFMVMYREAI